MDILSQIKEPIKAELVEFEAIFNDAVSNKYIVMGDVVSNAMNLKGKRMRPILTLLVAKMLGRVEKHHLAAAVMVEVTHNASLMHDDVIDEAAVRRGKPTLNTVVGSKGAVLAGDFLLACGIETGIKYNNFRGIQITAKTLKQLVEGELEQAMRAESLEMNRENYFQIINLKTAYLLGASAEVGAYVEVGTIFNHSDVEKDMYRFGELIGQAYQIKDDILDYVGSDSGKQKYNDLKEHKITLPLLVAFEKCGRREEIRNDLKSAANDSDALNRVADFVVKSGAVEACEGEVDKLREQARSILKKYPDNQARQALGLYCDFVTRRSY